MSARSDAGASTVELALLLPALLGLSGLLLTLALGFGTQVLVGRAAEAAARAAAVPADFAAGRYADDMELDAAARDAALLLPALEVLPVACDRTPCGPGAVIDVTVAYRWDNPAARLFGLLRPGGTDGYDFVTTVQRVRE